MELRDRVLRERGFEVQERDLFVEGGWIGSEQLEAEELAAGRSVSGRVRRVGTPFNEKGKQTVCVLFQVQCFPVQDAAVGAFARTGSGSLGGDSGSGKIGREHLKVAGMRRPSDQAWLGELFKLCWKFGGRASLLRIRRDDFEVAASAEREKRVLRAATWVNSAECRANTRVLFDESDAKLEIVAPEKDVIEHWWHLIDQRRHFRLLPLIAEEGVGNDERRTCDGHEGSTWDRSHGRSRNNNVDFTQIPAPGTRIVAIRRDSDLTELFGKYGSDRVKNWRAGMNEECRCEREKF